MQNISSILRRELKFRISVKKGGEKVVDFYKSDVGAQAAWKGFSSQTLYIASRLISDEGGYEYYPEDIEDLVVKKNGAVVEAVQVKNISADITLSSLAATKTSQSGEGFFNRMCSLHKQNPSFGCIKVVHFNALGAELQEVQKGNTNTKKAITKKLVEKHGLSVEDAAWLIDSVHFEKVNLDDLELNIQTQISEYVPVMSAPTLAKELLIHHISVLSKGKGYTTLKLWQEKIHEIGTNIAALDGFYKEYNKSLVRLDELQLNGDHKQLEKEYLQGVSAHPTHIRNNFDFKRNYWMEEIQAVINSKGVAILKGVSGQGKTTLCYRYLIDTYPEGWVFCVRTIANEGQAQNLVSALEGLGKHNKHLIIYIDVQPGETLCFINNSEIPSFLPNTDTERSSFGYALFWMAKRDRKVTLPFKVDEIVTSIYAGELQPSADAIRGLFEHPALEESYLAAVDIFVERLIREMQVLTFSVTSDEVSCKFIPPLSTETTIPENTKNTNQYWRIKMLDILKQLYPEKEYIDIELIGVDLLRDLGIEALDHKLHIHKSKRPNTWVSELNGWTKIRIDYSLRPSSWQEYVADIDEIRSNVNDLIVETIKLIDDVYRKGRYTQDRGKRVDDRLKVFKEHTFAENRLPTFAVDPYCLYSEGNAKSPVAEYFTMRQLLSVGKYEKFRKRLNDVYSSLDNFYNQFIEVLRVRINKQDISIVKNPRLAMFNLYSAAKAIVDFQKEYELLFSEYSSLNEDFAKQELENILTLVNVWRYVLDNQPKGCAIAYDSKQKYRKGTNYFCDTLSKAVTAVNGTLLKGNKHAYIIVDYNMEEDNTLENEYTRIVMTIRDVFKNSILPSSDRWYLETQSLELAYVPVFSGVLSPAVYSIPFYKLLDTEESRIAKPMYPCEIEPVLIEKMNATNSLKLWIESMKKLGEMKLYIQRYQQIVQTSIDEKCLCSMTAYTEMLIDQINTLWNDFILVEDLVSELIENANEQNSELLNVVKLFFNCYEELETVISTQNDPSELIQIIETVSIIMFLLLPSVS